MGLEGGTRQSVGVGGSGDDVQLPSDVNVEEAKMLEAAMLGIPYEGRIPQVGDEADLDRAAPTEEALQR